MLMATETKQKQAAKAFVKDWLGKGYEKGETARFWMDLLGRVFGITNPALFIQFEIPVKTFAKDKGADFIDAYIPTTRVLIEQKGSHVDLTAKAKQSDGMELTPFQQGLRYASGLGTGKYPHWIVACNFNTFEVHNMETPDAAPEVIRLADLEKEYTRLSFLVDDTNIHLKKELEVSIQAGEIVGVHPGPVVTLYEFKPVAGTKTARVIGLSDDIARSMCAVSVRIAVVPGTDTIGIEIPNAKRETVWFKDLIEDEAFSQTKNTLNVVLGKDISGKNVYADLAKMPHLLVAGTTGSGKSVGVNSMILSLLYKMTPQECKMIMIDPKMLEFSMYNDIPHLLTPVITDPAKAVAGLKWAVCEMEERYRKISDLHVRNIFGYNQKLKELKETGQTPTKTIQVGFDEEGRPIYEKQELDTTPMPYIVIVVDEVADLMIMARKEVEAAIQRLAQKARAAGIHLIMATQRPSVDVITGVIKANFPTRISFQVTSKFDSMTILGEKGAEQLLGMGDMLYMPAGLKPQRVHGSFVKDSEVEAVANFLKTQGAPEYVEDVTKIESGETDTGSVFDHTAMGGTGNDLYQQAVEIVRSDKKASTSYIQRRLRIGYNRAADLIDRMEKEGIVGPADHVGRREVL